MMYGNVRPPVPNEPGLLKPLRAGSFGPAVISRHSIGRFLPAKAFQRTRLQPPELITPSLITIPESDWYTLKYSSGSMAQNVLRVHWLPKRPIVAMLLAGRCGHGI